MNNENYHLDQIAGEYLNMDLDEADRDRCGCSLGRDGVWLCPSLVVDMMRRAFKAGAKYND